MILPTVDGTMVISKADLVGVALTHNPAFDSARVERVAAVEGEEEATEDSDSTVESDVIPTEGDEVENTVTDASAVETVEAAQSVTANSKPVGGFTSTRISDNIPFIQR